MAHTIDRKDISADTALELAKAAIEHARSKQWEICVSVCDSRGVPVALLKTDMVIDPAIGFAIDKAYTAATLRRTTAGFADRALEKPPLKIGLANRDRILVFPGGLPIFDGADCIGGIGVSGSRDHEDVECAEAALKAVGCQASAAS